MFRQTFVKVCAQIKGDDDFNTDDAKILGEIVYGY